MGKTDETTLGSFVPLASGPAMVRMGKKDERALGSFTLLASRPAMVEGDGRNGLRATS